MTVLSGIDVADLLQSRAETLRGHPGLEILCPRTPVDLRAFLVRSAPLQ
ncbi:hypothetical protein [Novosphingobium barchaimii]|nr:hypothetical protein [Novosphingobium barchaimii]